MTAPTLEKSALADGVHEYARAVVAGEIVTGRYVRLACERHLRDLERGASRGLHFDEEEASRTLEFFGFLTQRKGEWGGQRLKLQPWQVFRIGSVFGWKRADGTRRFRVAYNEVGRKNGKTTEAAGVGLKLAFFDDEPGAEVYAAATKRDQARICWSEAHWMVTHRNAPIGLKRRVTALTANLNDPSTGSKFEPLGADADSTDGLNIHGEIDDELHAWRNREFAEKLDTATSARRQPLRWIITTAGFDRTSLCWDAHDYSVKVLEGIVEDDSWFAYVAAIDDGDDWTDPEVWVKANPNLGVSTKLQTLMEKCKKAREIVREQSSFKRMYCGLWTESAEQWIATELWDRQKKRAKRKELVGRECFAGVDLSSTRDITALVLWFPDPAGDGGDVLPFFFVPEEGLADREKNDRVPYTQWVADGHITATPGPVVDYDFIEERLAELAEKYEVRAVAKDPWQAVQFGAHVRNNLALTVVDVPQNTGRLNAPTRELERLLSLRGVRHGGNPVLRWMASNAVSLEDARGNIRIDKAKSRNKIDGIAALVNALSESMVAGPKETSGEYHIYDLGIDRTLPAWQDFSRL